LGGDFLQHLLKCTCSNGRLVNISTIAHGTVPIDLHDLYRRQVKLIGSNSLYLHSEESAHILRLLTPNFETGKLQAPDIHSVIDLTPQIQAAVPTTTSTPASDAASPHKKPSLIGSAFQSVQNGARGKVVLQFHKEEENGIHI